MNISQDMSINQKDLATKLSGRFRNCLSLLGLSRDEHIFDIDLSYITFFQDQDALGFIKTVQEFYQKLDPLDRILFINEYLEFGRHQKYWWLYYFDLEDFRKARDDMVHLVNEKLGGCLDA